MEDGWLDNQCQGMNLGDSRRCAVVRNMLHSAAMRPAGTIAEVMHTPPERQAAYKVLEKGHVTYSPLRQAFGAATARMARGLDHVFVALDGSSLSLADHAGNKFGSVGATRDGGRGVKMISAYALSPDVVPLGILDQQWWCREPRLKKDKKKQRKLADRETVHWLAAITASQERLAEEAPDTRLWFIADREADGFHILDRVREKFLFTIRGNANRRVITERGKKSYVNDELRKQPYSVQSLEVPETAKRRARTARLHVRIAQVTLDMVESWSRRRLQLPVNVVELREVYTTPCGEKPIVWRLYTNHGVETPEDVALVIKSYRARWRIEELHKTWKTGACDVENSQLRSKGALLIWATIMATVAARIERLKVLSRNTPEAPAETAFSASELKALLLLRRKYKKRNERAPTRVPNIGVAVLWVAEMGGYTGKSSGGPPGATTIRRGLDELRPAAQLLEILDIQ